MPPSERVSSARPGGRLSSILLLCAQTRVPLAPQIEMTAGIERRREIRRLRTRRKKTAKLIARVKAGSMDKSEAIRKLRQLTPGADVVIDREGWQ